MEKYKSNLDVFFSFCPISRYTRTSGKNEGTNLNLVILVHYTKVLEYILVPLDHSIYLYKHGRSEWLKQNILRY